MPDNDRKIAQTLQQKYYGNPQGLAEHLAKICLNQIGVVQEVFIILTNFTTLDVGYRFVNLVSSATFSRLTGTKKGKAFCELLLSWLKNTTVNGNPQIVAPGVDSVIQLMKLKNAIDNAPQVNEKEENPYYTIDRGIILSKETLIVLNKIGAEYYKKVGKNLM